MPDLARLTRGSRAAAFALVGLLGIASSGCSSCKNRAQRYAAEYGTDLLATKINEAVSKAEVSAPGKTTSVRLKEEDAPVEAYVTYELPSVWPADVFRPPHATLLKGVDLVESEGTSGFHLYALYDSRDAMADVEKSVRDAGGTNIVDHVAPDIGKTRAHVFTLEHLPAWTGCVFLSAGPEGHTWIGIQVTREDALANAEEAKKVAAAKEVLSAAKEVEDAAPPASDKRPRFDVMIGKIKSKSGAIRDADRVLAMLRPRLRQCYVVGQPAGSHQPASLVVDMKVVASGDVGSVDVVESDGIDGSTKSCITMVLKRPQFTMVVESPAEIELPIWFAARD